MTFLGCIPPNPFEVPLAEAIPLADQPHLLQVSRLYQNPVFFIFSLVFKLTILSSHSPMLEKRIYLDGRVKVSTRPRTWLVKV